MKNRGFKYFINSKFYDLLLWLGVINDNLTRVELYKRFDKNFIDNAINKGVVKRSVDKQSGHYVYSLKEFYLNHYNYEPF